MVAVTLGASPHEVTMPKQIDALSFVPSAGPRVLVEATEWASRETMSAVLRDKGYNVIGCPGPEGSDERCALVASGDCSAAKEADVIVHTLRHSDERNREVLLDLQRHYPDTPIVVEVPTPTVERFADDFARCEVVPFPMTATTLLAGVRTALGSGRAAKEA